jgi:hypothetical protein
MIFSLVDVYIDGFEQVPCVSWKKIKTHLGESSKDNYTSAFSLE